MTREDIECIIKWFSHIEQLATDGKTANGFQMPTDKILATIKVVAKDSREYVEKFCNDSVPNGLEEAANEYEKKHTYQRYDGGGFTPEYDATLAEAVIFGAKWQKEQDEKELSEKIAAAYQLGLADKEKQMMKNAKDGWIDEEDVIILNDGTSIDLQPDFEKKPAFKFEYAQDVQVIVLPKEDNND